MIYVTLVKIVLTDIIKLQTVHKHYIILNLLYIYAGVEQISCLYLLNVRPFLMARETVTNT